MGRSESRTVEECTISSVSCKSFLGNLPRHPAFAMTCVPINQPKQATDLKREPSREYPCDTDKGTTKLEITTVIQNLALDLINWISLEKLFNSGVCSFLNSKLEIKIPPGLPQSLWKY